MIRKGSIFLACLVAVVVLAAIVSRQIFVRPPAQPQTLPDGNVLTLTDTKVGSKVRFVHGTLWERLKQNVLPAKGIKFGSHSIVPQRLPVTSLNAVADRRLFLEFKIDGRVTVINTLPASVGRMIASSNPVPAKALPASIVTGSQPPTTDAAFVSGNVSFASVRTNSGRIIASPVGVQPGSPVSARGTTLPLAPAIPQASRLGAPPTSSFVTLGSFIAASPATANFTINPIIPNGQFRMVLKGDDGFEYVESFWPQLGFATNGYIYIEPQNYPRDSSRLSVSIERRDTASQPWKAVAEFNTRITPESGPSLRPQKLPLKKTIGEFDFVLGELSVRDTTFPPEYIGKFQSDLAFQVLQNGAPQTNWEVFPLMATDSAGNSSSLGSFGRFSNGWYRLQTPQALNANRPWRLRMSFGRMSDFPSNQLASFNLNLTDVVSLGMAVRPMTNELLGVPVRVFGDSQNLHIALPADRTDLRLTLVKLRWPNGTEREGDGTHWNERQVTLDPTSLPALGKVNVTVAIHPNYPIEFVVQPESKIASRK